MLLLLCQLLNRLATALTAFLAPGNLPLQSTELGERLLQVFWAVKRCAIAKCQGVRDTQVYANVLPGLRFRQLNLQAYVPTGWLPQDDVFELAIWKRAVPASVQATRYEGCLDFRDSQDRGLMQSSCMPQFIRHTLPSVESSSSASCGPHVPSS